MHTRLLDASAMRELVRRVGVDELMDALIARLTESIRSYCPARDQVPARSGVIYEVPEWGLLETMPAHVGGSGTTVKLVGYHPMNPSVRGLPSVLSTICTFDMHGHLTGLLDGTFATALRTGAASAVASRVLAKPESRTLGIIGCGAQAVSQLHALSRIFDLTSIIGFDVDPEAAATFPHRTAFLDLQVRSVHQDARAELLEKADILCTCTSSQPGEGPVFADGAHQPHLHINAVGSDFAGKYEVPLSLLQRATVCPDFTQQALREGDCQQLDPSLVGPDLVALVQNDSELHRLREGLTVFDSTGWAMEDYVAARLFLDYARDMDLGRDITLECLPSDPKDPYAFLTEELEAAAGAPASLGN